MLCLIPGNPDHRRYHSAGLSQNENGLRKNFLSLLIKSFKQLEMLFQYKYAHKLCTKDRQFSIASGTCYGTNKMNVTFFYACTVRPV